MIFSIIPNRAEWDHYLEIANTYSVRFEYNDFTMPEIYDCRQKTEERIQFYKESGRNLTGDTMHGAFLGLDIAAVDPVLRDRSRALIRQSVEIADRMGLKGVVFHTGLIGGLRLSYYLENWVTQATSFYTELCKQYPRLFIYMENSFEKEPDVFVKLMEKMKTVENFRLCLDYGHAILTQTPIEKWVKELAPYIGHMHVNDNDLRDDLHLIPGTGSIDFEKWKNLMDQYGIDSSVLLELQGAENSLKALQFMRTL